MSLKAPAIGEYYIIKSTETKAIIKIVSVYDAEFEDEISDSEELWFADEIASVRGSALGIGINRWSQYIKDFNDMMQGKHEHFKMEKIEIEDYPEYLLWTKVLKSNLFLQIIQ